MNYTFKNITYQAELSREVTKESGLTYRRHSILLQSDTQDIEIPLTREEYEEAVEYPHFMLRSLIREKISAGKFNTLTHVI